jgi:hypothetical protein
MCEFPAWALIKKPRSRAASGTRNDAAQSRTRLRPDFHPLEDRVGGHMLMPLPPGCSILRRVGMRFEDHNDTRDWQTIRRLLCTHSLVSPGSRSPTGAGSISAKPANPTTNKSASTKCSASTGNQPSRQEKPKSRPEEIVVPLERHPRFYGASRPPVRSLG